METDWDYENVIEYYRRNRKTISGLYDSEKYFLTKLNLDNFRILDIGCAEGGFYDIFTSLAENVLYTGVDVSEKMITIAKQLYPDAEFYSVDPELRNLRFEDNSFDLVFSSGVFHLNSSWREMLKAGYRKSKRYMLIDFRILPDRSVTGKMQLSYGKPDSDSPKIDYFVIDINELMTIIKGFSPVPKSVAAYGYYHQVSDDADIDLDKVCMAFFLIEKDLNNNYDKINFELDLPDDFGYI